VKKYKMPADIPTTSEDNSENELNRALLRAVVKLNTRLLAGVFGCVFGLALFLLTYLSLFRGLPHTGQYLNLLGVFLPGYEVSHAGAWIGLFWGAVIGAFLAAMFYRIYARGVTAQIQLICNPETKVDRLLGATLYFEGKSLGIALGAIIAVGLIVTTNWLVLKGTADESVHAMLLVNYLPGYSISLAGSIVGAVELFAVTFLLSLLFSWIYNRVASSRVAESG
jgi:hypothetical protein